MDEAFWAPLGFYALDQTVQADLRALPRDGAATGHAYHNPWDAYDPRVPGVGAPEWDAHNHGGELRSSGQADSQMITSRERLIRKRQL